MVEGGPSPGIGQKPPLAVVVREVAFHFFGTDRPWDGAFLGGLARPFPDAAPWDSPPGAPGDREPALFAGRADPGPPGAFLFHENPAGFRLAVVRWAVEALALPPDEPRAYLAAGNEPAPARPAPADVRPLGTAAVIGAPHEPGPAATGPSRYVQPTVGQPVTAAIDPLPLAVPGEQPPANEPEPGDVPAPPLVPGLAAVAANVGASLGLRVPAADPLAGALPLDLSAVRDGARTFFDRLAGLAPLRPVPSGWSRLYYVTAGVLLVAAGLSFRAVTRRPRRPAPGPAAVFVPKLLGGGPDGARTG
jgi:hypothetical protein